MVYIETHVMFSGSNFFLPFPAPRSSLMGLSGSNGVHSDSDHINQQPVSYNANGDSTAVVTRSDLPANFILGQISNSCRLPVCLTDEPVVKQVIEVHLTSARHLVDTTGSTNWVNWVSAARDCLEQNVSLDVESSLPAGFSYSSMAVSCGVSCSPQLVLRTVKPIRAGEQLFVWFTDIHALRLGVPVLLPHNILGFRQYRCTHCGREFLFPNVLKCHLMTRACQPIRRATPRQPPVTSPLSFTQSLSAFSPSLPGPIDTLWCLEFLSRLAGGASSTSATPGEVSGKIPICPPSPNSITRSYPAANAATSDKILETPVTTADSNSRVNIIPKVTTSSDTFPLLPNTTEPLDLIPRSLYTSKNHRGHLCIYCGKLYSRKYGLKIHLRTHTGYKPLKCKICFRPFGDPSNLNKHVRLHAEGETPYRCEFCSKVLVRRRDLDRHIRSRHADQGRQFLAGETIFLSSNVDEEEEEEEEMREAGDEESLFVGESDCDGHEEECASFPKVSKL